MTKNRKRNDLNSLVWSMFYCVCFCISGGAAVDYFDTDSSLLFMLWGVLGLAAGVTFYCLVFKLSPFINRKTSSRKTKKLISASKETLSRSTDPSNFKASIDELFSIALALEKRGDWREAIEIYNRLEVNLRGEPNHEYAINCAKRLTELDPSLLHSDVETEGTARAIVAPRNAGEKKCDTVVPAVVGDGESQSTSPDSVIDTRLDQAYDVAATLAGFGCLSIVWIGLLLLLWPASLWLSTAVALFVVVTYASNRKYWKQSDSWKRKLGLAALLGIRENSRLLIIGLACLFCIQILLSLFGQNMMSEETMLGIRGVACVYFEQAAFLFSYPILVTLVCLLVLAHWWSYAMRLLSKSLRVQRSVTRVLALLAPVAYFSIFAHVTVQQKYGTWMVSLRQELIEQEDEVQSLMKEEVFLDKVAELLRALSPEQRVLLAFTIKQIAQTPEFRNNISYRIGESLARVDSRATDLVSMAFEHRSKNGATLEVPKANAKQLKEQIDHAHLEQSRLAQRVAATRSIAVDLLNEVAADAGLQVDESITGQIVDGMSESLNDSIVQRATRVLRDNRERLQRFLDTKVKPLVSLNVTLESELESNKVDPKKEIESRVSKLHKEAKVADDLRKAMEIRIYAWEQQSDGPRRFRGRR